MKRYGSEVDPILRKSLSVILWNVLKMNPIQRQLLQSEKPNECKPKCRTCLCCGGRRSIAWRPAAIFTGFFIEKKPNCNNIERMLCNKCYTYEQGVRQIRNFILILFFELIINLSETKEAAKSHTRNSRRIHIKLFWGELWGLEFDRCTKSNPATCINNDE